MTSNANTPQRVDVERFDLHGVSYVRSTDHDARIAAMLLQVAELEKDRDEWKARREEVQEGLATLQVIHNCLRRDHERSKAQAKAAREIAEQWNADARAEGFGGGSVKGREIIEAMDAAFLAANGGSNG